jgi:hypothetical protein
VEEELQRQEEEFRELLLEKKVNLSTSKRKKLRERAMEAIRNTEGIKENFISEALIEAKENEILKDEMK